jgi:hypothetical protein
MKRRTQTRRYIEDDILSMIRLGSIVLLLGSFIRLFWFNDSDWFATMVISIMSITLLPTKLTHPQEDEDEI